MSIILYDIPSTVGPWSPNTWKVRYCLNFKGIPHKTEWVEYPDIAAHCQRLGIAPTGTQRDGSPYYSLPAIYDLSTNTYMADSVPIVEYLEKQYPDTPTVFPNNTIGLAIEFEDALNVELESLWKFTIPLAYNILNPTSQGFYRTTREKKYGKKLEDVPPKLDTEEGSKEWAKAKAGFATMAAWYSRNDGGPFLMGEKVSWADFVVGGHLIWFKKAWGEDDKKWQDVLSWDGGVWKILGTALQQYENVV